MNRVTKTLLIALLISILIHLALFGVVPEIKWPDFRVEEFKAEIVNPPKPVHFKPLAPPKPKEHAKKSAPRLEKRPVPIAASEPLPESAPGPEPLPMSAALSASIPVPASASQPVEKTAGKAAENKTEVPRHAKLVFRVFRGKDVIVGMAVHTWDIMDDGRYVITNKVEAVGIFALFVSKSITQVSEGHVTENGLRPDLYIITRGGMENRQTAHFDWKAMKLVFASNGSSKEVDLAPSAQDQLSFLYQFAYTPPKSGVFTFIATDGRKIDTYEYRILGEETIFAGTKKFRTLHLKKLHDSGVESTEIWLDEDHYYWPVQVMMADKNGDVMKQVISEIQEK